MKLYAKFDIDGSFLPLRNHLEETVFTMSYLFDHWLPESVKQFLTESMEITEDQLRKFLVLTAYLHDIGKATLIFQDQAWKMLDEDRPEFLYLDSVNPERRKLLHHSTSGAAIFEKYGFNKGFTTIIGSHHGRWRTNFRGSYLTANRMYLSGVGKANTNDLFTPEWDQIIHEGLSLSNFEINNLPNPGRASQMLITGILNMADWLSSDTKYFPLLTQLDDEISVEERCRQAESEFSITAPWESFHFMNTEDDFIQTFGMIPRAVQKDVIQILADIEEAGLMIIEAPMGCGKTEAALYAAQILAFHSQAGGIFYGLPTVATTNGIMDRIYKWAEKECINENLSFQLVHAKTMFNEQYQDYRRNSSDLGGLVVSSWMEKKKLRLCPNFVVGTVDYLLRSSLKHNHVMLDHIGVAGKVIILDEIHCFDAYMNEYFFRALEWLGYYRTPVILLSATLSSELRKQVLESYMKGIGITIDEAVMEKCVSSSAYPLISMVNKSGLRFLQDRDTGNFKKVTLKKEESWKFLKSSLFERLSGGGCAGIIVNTVRQAQSLFESLSDLKDQGFRIKLLHSSFTDVDRGAIESEILTLIGKPRFSDDLEAYKNREKLIVIGTQVLEQSLDIDFDWLITEICPVDLLLQRIGRLHRHDRVRPESLKNPECWIVGTSLENLDSGTVSIYQKWLLHKTLECIKNKNEIVLPTDIPCLIGEVYQSKEDILLTSEEQQFLQEFRKEIADKQSSAGCYLIGEPEGAKDIREINKISSPIDAEKYGNQAVRDCGMSIEVILVSTDFCEDAVITDGSVVSLNDVPDFKTSGKILRSKIKLPSVFTKDYSIASVISELERRTQNGFEQWLRSKQIYGELVLPMDREWEGELNGWKLEYSSESGLKFRKEEMNE